MVGIYIITSPTNKVYIGQSRCIKNRVRQYNKLSCQAQTKLYASLKKYGWNAHTFEIVLELRDDVSQDTLNFWEEYFMDLYKANHVLLNIREAGSNGKMSDETKRKIGESNKGKKRSLEIIAKLRISKTGRTASLETRERMSVTQKKIAITKKFTPMMGGNNPAATAVMQFSLDGELLKTWAAMSEARRVLNITNIAGCCINNQKTAGGFIWIREKDFTENLLNKALSKASTKKLRRDCIKVNQLDVDRNIIKEWPSIKMAAKALNISDTRISLCCKGKANIAGGFLWEYNK